MLNEKEKSNDYNDWLKNSIKDEYLSYYEHSNFKITKSIGSGHFGKVLCANLKNTDTIFALKSFNTEFSLKDIVNEIKLHKHVDFHQNILRFHGITWMESETFQRSYSLVLQYADSGTLETYLTEHFNELGWNDKHQLAFQLASAVECIHNLDIIHCDLHANNVLVHQKNIKLADFGLSRKITKDSSNAYNTSLHGAVPYLDPKSFNNLKVNDEQNYVLNKKSDVYSIGVLMWQISSGRIPFDTEIHDVTLAIGILCGRREKIVEGTPKKYSDLYKECWKHEEIERPDMKEVVSLLKSLILPEENKQSNSSIIIDPKGIILSEKSDEIYNSKIENISLNISEKSVVTDDFSDLTIENIQIIDENKSENSLSSQNQNTTQLNVTYPVSSDIPYTNKFKELGKKIFLDPLKYIYFKLYEYDLPKSKIWRKLLTGIERQIL
ncbi:uncharacterized protein OCT59_014129 [Rhizophagus irregularis]|uniref:uncharacterized protein n=1 Tax=Rhizophagus irregularis TaxID=588596 RepID=UPI003325EC92|nr:hypothetical protein OCT59_014129 [Rhizophagus irregularis]